MTNTIKILSVFIVICSIICCNTIKKEIKISFITSQRHTAIDLACANLLNSFEWVIISNNAQKNNWEIAGYIIPYVDFDKNNLIISRFKITKLYYNTHKTKYNGVPNGEVIVNIKDSDKNYYYFYLMPKIMLAQGVG